MKTPPPIGRPSLFRDRDGRIFVGTWTGQFIDERPYVNFSGATFGTAVYDWAELPVIDWKPTA